MEFNCYEEIYQYRVKCLNSTFLENKKLNEIHDLIMKNVITLAEKITRSNFGDPPCEYTFFVMGSAGRQEQSIWSDQDHGIVFEHSSQEAQTYFLHLGSEISKGLETTGYMKCNGGVMSDNPRWCKSLAEWERQLKSWAKEKSWESLRYLLIFSDARSLIEFSPLLLSLKTIMLRLIIQEKLLFRMLQNTMHVKKGIGVLGQILYETHGIFSGSINLKDTALLPYVNAARILALQHSILETTTLKRMESVQGSLQKNQEIEAFSKLFRDLLHFRLQNSNHQDYESGHYVSGVHLSKQEKKQLKEIIIGGNHFFDLARKIVEKGVKHGHE